MSKYFNYISKDLKSNDKPNFFPTSTLSKHTPLPQATYFKQSIVEMGSF
jgi:hypothetical protein